MKPSADLKYISLILATLSLSLYHDGMPLLLSETIVKLVTLQIFPQVKNRPGYPWHQETKEREWLKLNRPVVVVCVPVRRENDFSTFFSLFCSSDFFFCFPQPPFQ
jgi:hypothetical protein